jgi:death-on-curing protein
LPSGRGHYRITLDDALEAHHYALAFGGLPGIRHEPGIRAAIGRPYSGYYRAIERKAAALFESVACGHAFTDGNKRTAVLLVDLLLERSGYRLVPATARENLTTEYEAFALWVITEHPDFDDIVAWYRARIIRSSGSPASGR